MKHLIFGFVQMALLIGLLSATSQTRTAPTPPAGDENVLLDNTNSYGVGNGPTVPTKFTVRQPYVITMIMDYHWNNGQGTSVGTIGLRGPEDHIYGPWPVTGSPGQGGVPNAFWTAAPNIKLPKGEYTIIDSEPSTWSQNSQSGNRGFSTVKGYPWEDPTPTPTPTPTAQRVTAIVENKTNVNQLICLEGQEPHDMRGVLRCHTGPGAKQGIKVSIPPDGRITFVHGALSSDFKVWRVLAKCTWTGDPKDPSRTPHVVFDASGQLVCGTDKK